jgi:hypothetical protein
MDQPCILLYNLRNAKGNKIEKLCSRLKITVKYIAETDYLEPIGNLAGLSQDKEIIEDRQNQAREDFYEEMLVMSQFLDKLLDTFLKEYKKKHIDPVLLKAIITTQNKAWNSIQLKEELKREHQALN